MTYPPPANPDPYGQQPVDPYSQPAQPAPNPYAPGVSGDPYAAQPPVSGAPGSPPPINPEPYAQPPVNPDPYAQPSPYAQQPVTPDPYQATPPPPYGAQPYPQAAYPGNAAPGNNGLAIGSMVTGILSIVLCCCYLGIPLGAVGLALGLIGKKQIAERGQSGAGMATAGIITGAVGIGLGILQIILVAFDVAGNYNYNFG